MSGAIIVRDIMTKSVKTAKLNDKVIEAVRKMNKFNIGSIVVLKGRRPIGILTERDLLKRIVEPGMDPSIVEVKGIMSSPVVTINPETSIEDAARLMTKKGIKKLLVVEDNKLVGIVFSMDLMRAGPKLVDLLDELYQIRKAS